MSKTATLIEIPIPNSESHNKSKSKVPTIRCSMNTIAGAQCSKLCKLPDTICKQHQKLNEKKLNPSIPKKSPIVRCRCEGLTKKALQCRIMVNMEKRPNGLCHHHTNQVKSIAPIAIISNEKAVDINYALPNYDLFKEKLNQAESLSIPAAGSVLSDAISIANKLSPTNMPNLIMEDVSDTTNNNSLVKRQRIKNK